MNITFRPELHPRNRLGRFREILGSLKPGDSVTVPGQARIQKRGRGAFRVTTRYGASKMDKYAPMQMVGVRGQGGDPLGQRQIQRDVTPMSVNKALGDKDSADTVARLVGMDSAPASPGVPGRLSPEAKAAQVQRVRDSLLMTKDLPGKGLEDKKTRRVLPPMSPGTGTPADAVAQLDAMVKGSRVSVGGKNWELRRYGGYSGAPFEWMHSVTDATGERHPNGFPIVEHLSSKDLVSKYGSSPITVLPRFDLPLSPGGKPMPPQSPGTGGGLDENSIIDITGKAETAVEVASDQFDAMAEDQNKVSDIGFDDVQETIREINRSLADGTEPDWYDAHDAIKAVYVNAEGEGWINGHVQKQGLLDNIAKAENALMMAEDSYDQMIEDTSPQSPGTGYDQGSLRMDLSSLDSEAQNLDAEVGDNKSAQIVSMTDELRGFSDDPEYVLSALEDVALAARDAIQDGNNSEATKNKFSEIYDMAYGIRKDIQGMMPSSPQSPGTDFDEDPSDQAMLNKDRIDQDRWNKALHSPLMKRIEAQDVAIEFGGAADAVLDPAELDKLVGGQLDYLFDNTRGSGHSFNFRQQIAQEIKRREGEDKAYDGADYDRYKPRGADGLVDLALMADRFGFEPNPPQSPGTLGTVAQRQAKLAELIGQLSSDNGTVLPAGSETAANLLGEIEVQAGSLANQPGGGFASLSPMQRGVLGDIAVDNNFHTLAGRADINQLFRVRPTTPVEVLSNVPTGAELNVSGARYKKVGDGEPGDFGAYVPVDENGIPRTFGPNTAWSKTGNQLKDDVVKVARVESGEADVTSLYFDETASLTEAAVAQELARKQRKLARQKPGARDKDLEETAELLETLLEDVSEADPQD